MFPTMALSPCKIRTEVEVIFEELFAFVVSSNLFQTPVHRPAASDLRRLINIQIPGSEGLGWSPPFAERHPSEPGDPPDFESFCLED